MIIDQEITLDNASAIILTEGKTDWQHIEKAKNKLQIDLNIYFLKETEEMGDGNLLKRCEIISKTPIPLPIPLIFIFDNDNRQIVDKISGQETLYKKWKDNLFSFAIPKPLHRKEHKGVSIEFYYTDEEIKLSDSEGRRLFLSSEFDKKTGNHKTDSAIHVKYLNRIENCTEENNAKIVDADIGVIRDGNNIALSKANFTENILDEKSPFNNINFESFRNIFEIIQNIIQICPKPKEVSKEPTDNLLKSESYGVISNDFAIQFSQLTLVEKLLIRVIGTLKKVNIELVKLIAMTMKTSPDCTYEHIADTSIVVLHHPTIPTLGEISINENALTQAYQLTIEDIRYIVINLKKFFDSDKHKLYDTDYFYLEWDIQSMLEQFKQQIYREGLLKDLLFNQIYQIEYRIKGYTYCEPCQAYFLIFEIQVCPNCGGSINQENKIIDERKQVNYTPSIPFPNIELLKHGNFDLSKGVNSNQIRYLQKLLSSVSKL